MKKYSSKITNAVLPAKWRIKRTKLPSFTTNGGIRPATFVRECEEYDAGLLPVEHELYIGERGNKSDLSVVN